MTVNFQDKNLFIKGNVDYKKLNLKMKVFQENHINTKTLPSTIPVLSQNLPSIFKCQCFNEANKNFMDESQETELGHLFEHIMLEYLCIEKIKNGSEEAVYEGVTRWNWIDEEPGTFNIEITVVENEVENIEHAFNNSITLLSKILA